MKVYVKNHDAVRSSINSDISLNVTNDPHEMTIMKNISKEISGN